MQDDSPLLGTSLADLPAAEWRARLASIAEKEGNFEPLGAAHFATFIDRGDTLLVTFETEQGIRALSERAQPLGFDMVRREGWSHLCMISDGDTWFRAPQVYSLFDRLDDDGFFEDFSTVLFYGAGPCGYAAAAFSVAAPGAQVLAIQPQATLDPRMTEWDDRFTDMRRTDFTARYGYAPEMLEAAARATILYDPREELDAMHAALFRARNVQRFRMPNMGDALQTTLLEMDILHDLLALAAAGGLDSLSFARALRARRGCVSYLRGLMARLDADARPYLAMLLARNVTARMDAPRFRRRLEALEQEAASGKFRAPPRRPAA